jgi:hypothetical protein
MTASNFLFCRQRKWLNDYHHNDAYRYCGKFVMDCPLYDENILTIAARNYIIMLWHDDGELQEHGGRRVRESVILNDFTDG